MPSESSPKDEPLEDTESLLSGVVDELLDCLDRARKIEDLYQSACAQRAILNAIIFILELTDQRPPTTK